MSDYNIRIAEIDDAEALQKLMHEAFTPLRELGIDWPSVNASVEMVEKIYKRVRLLSWKITRKLFQR